MSRTWQNCLHVGCVSLLLFFISSLLGLGITRSWFVCAILSSVPWPYFCRRSEQRGARSDNGGAITEEPPDHPPIKSSDTLPVYRSLIGRCSACTDLMFLDMRAVSQRSEENTWNSRESLLNLYSVLFQLMYHLVTNMWYIWTIKWSKIIFFIYWKHFHDRFFRFIFSFIVISIQSVIKCYLTC